MRSLAHALPTILIPRPGIRWTVLALLILPSIALGESRLRYITIGPMLHWNFGKKESALSFGVEAAYWDFPPGQALFDMGTKVPGDGEVGFGLDLGVEWEGEGEKIRAYAEPQLGMLPAGIALGSVLEWDLASHDFHVGTQGSLWGNLAFVGADIRGRIVDGKKSLAPGLYVKAPIPL